MAKGFNALALLAAAALLGIVATTRAAAMREPTRRQSRPARPRRTYDDPRVWPVAGAPPLTVKGRYLNQRSATRRHRGIDLHGAAGDPVYAPAAGVVTHAGPERPGFRGYGPEFIAIDHGGVWTLLGHLERVRVRHGDRVNTGDVIGQVAAGVVPPHVHFEAALRDYPMDSEADRIDPAAWLRGEL